MRLDFAEPMRYHPTLCVNQIAERRVRMRMTVTATKLFAILIPLPSHAELKFQSLKIECDCPKSRAEATDVLPGKRAGCDGWMHQWTVVFPSAREMDRRPSHETWICCALQPFSQHRLFPVRSQPHHNEQAGARTVFFLYIHTVDAVHQCFPCAKSSLSLNSHQ